MKLEILMKKLLGLSMAIQLVKKIIQIFHQNLNLTKNEVML